MNKNSYLCNFIQQHKNWRELLSSSPYSINIKEEGYYAIFNYNMIKNPDFTLPEVQEARGIIINLFNLEVVCWPFRKFGNYGEFYVDDIDWSTAKVQEKVDGSIIKVWWAGTAWQISSNSAIDLNKTSEYCQLAASVLGNKIEEFNKDYTYIFELVSPETQVVVRYDKVDIYHIGTRNNKTGEEVNWDIGIQKPKEYKLNSLDACIEAAAALNIEDNITNEGFVVVDSRYHRIKIKSPLYVAAHHLRANINITPSRIYDIIMAGEQEEYLTYFPNEKEKFDEFIHKFNAYVLYVCSLYEFCELYGKDDKVAFILKEIAEEDKYIAWAWKSGKTSLDFINGLSKKKLLKILYGAD